MRSEEISGISSEPDSEMEWEDLLLRLEIMPRALRFALDSNGRDSTGKATQILEELKQRDATTIAFLERACGGDDGPALSGGGTRISQTVDGYADNLDTVARLRARMFAMVQRRGIEVWKGTARLEDGGTVTVHQVLSHVAAKDGETLARIRGIVAEAPGAC